MKIKILQKTTHVGFDWHDSFSLTEYITKKSAKEGDFDITGLNPTLLIADDIFNKLNGIGFDSEDSEGNREEERIKENYIPSFQEIVKILSNKERWTLSQEASDYISASIYYEDGSVTCSCNTCGFDDTSHYEVIDIPDEQVRYAALEEIYAAFKGAYTIQRIYDEPFKTYEEAKAALEKIPAERENYSTGRYIQIISSKYMENEHFKFFFSNNMKMKQAEEANPGKFYLRACEIA